jgi:hypothetical protein
VKAVLGANTFALAVGEKIHRCDILALEDLLNESIVWNDSVDSWTRRSIVWSVLRESFEGFECLL